MTPPDRRHKAGAAESARSPAGGRRWRRRGGQPGASKGRGEEAGTAPCRESEGRDSPSEGLQAPVVVFPSEGPCWVSRRKQLCLGFVQVARAHHVQAESYLVYNIMSSGEIECGNTLEDALDQALPSQAFVYRPVRQRVYALLLGAGAGEPRRPAAQAGRIGRIGPDRAGSGRMRPSQNTEIIERVLVQIL